MKRKLMELHRTPRVTYWSGGAVTLTSLSICTYLTLYNVMYIRTIVSTAVYSTASDKNRLWTRANRQGI